MPKGMFFEDLELGLKISTKGRTITEADVVNFAGLSGDFNPLHVDAEFARGVEFGQRVAHGTLVLSVATGLTYQAGFMEDTVMAFLSLDWRYSAPTFLGDTIHCEVEVTDLKLMRRLGGGKVTLAIKVLNQEDKVVQKGDWVVLVRSREAGQGDG